MNWINVREKNSSLAIYVLIAYIMILPFGGTLILRNILFLLLVVSSIFWGKYKKLYFPILLPWVAWLSISLISVAYAYSWKYSINEWRVECVYDFFIFYFAVNVIENRGRLKILVLAVLFLTLINSGGGALLWALNIPSKDGLFGGINSGVGSYSTYAILSVPMLVWLWCSLPKSGELKLKVIIVLAVVLLFLNLLIGKNRQVWISFVFEIVTALLLLQKHGKLKMGPLPTFLAIGAGVGMSIGALLARAGDWKITTVMNALVKDERWQIWTECLVKAGNYRMSGSGVGTYSFYMQYPGVWTDSMIHHGHNIILNKYLQMGYPGALIFIVLLFSLFNLFRRNRDSSYANVVGITIVVGMISKNVTDDFFGRDVGYFFWAIVGAMVGACLRRNQREMASL